MPAHLRERLRFETLLADISSHFVNMPAERVDDEIESAQRAICQCLGLEHSSVWQVAPEDPTVLVLTHLVRDPNLPPPPRRMAGHAFFPWAQSKLVRKKLVCIVDTRNVPPEASRDAATWQQFGIKSTLGIPLSAGGGPVFGVLSFEATSRRRSWPEELQKRLTVLASVFANSLARKQVELKLRESEARLTLAAQSANAGLWTLNPVSGEVWATMLALQLFGVAADESLTIDRLIELIHPQDRERVRRAIDRAVRTGEESAVEYRVVRADGKVPRL